MYSDLCPVNYIFTENKRYYHGIICTNKFTYDKCDGLSNDKEIIYLPNTFEVNSKIKYIPKNILVDNIKYMHYVEKTIA